MFFNLNFANEFFYVLVLYTSHFSFYKGCRLRVGSLTVDFFLFQSQASKRYLQCDFHVTRFLWLWDAQFFCKNIYSFWNNSLYSLTELSERNLLKFSVNNMSSLTLTPAGYPRISCCFSADFELLFRRFPRLLRTIWLLWCSKRSFK